MKLHPSESIIVETVGGRMLRISVDAECGDNSIKLTDLSGTLEIKPLFANQIMATSVWPSKAAAPPAAKKKP